jgi:hypothetical protein
MLNSLQLWRVNHVRKKANGLAYRLTKEAFFLMDEQVHMEGGHLSILDIIIDEHCNI